MNNPGWLDEMCYKWSSRGLGGSLRSTGVKRIGIPKFRNPKSRNSKFFMLRSRSSRGAPAGFHRVLVGHRQHMLVADGRDANAMAACVLSPSGIDTETRYVGRARLRSIQLGDGGTGLVRSYQHGGTFRHCSRDWFVTWPPRPFLELTVTHEARRRGVGTPEVVAALVACGWGPFYRGWLVTRELEGARDLWSCFQAEEFATSTTSLMGLVGRAVRLMHHVGVYHADLNMRNVLVRLGSNEVEVFIIDFDKGRLFERPVPSSYRRRNLERLLRSVRKLDPSRRYVSDEDWSALLVAYHG